MTTTLIIPGLYSSGPGHWQTWFEEQIPGTVRVIQSDWTKPDLSDWSRRVRRDLVKNPGRHILVAHSFGVLAAVHAATDLSDRIDAALLVAPADPDKFGVADLLPQDPLPFSTVVVASSNDPWMDLWTAAGLADRWGADFVNLGEAGHINAESGFGPWPEGLALFERLRRHAQNKSVGSGRSIRARSRPGAWKHDGRKSDATDVRRDGVRRQLIASQRFGAG
jgi:predicted alpha/beta hydrolase family esterase